MLRRALRKGVGRFERECDQGGSDVGDMAGAGPYSACPSSRVTDRLAAALLGVFGLAEPAAALVSVQPAVVNAYTMGPGRIGALVAAVVGLIGVIAGGMALARSARRIGNRGRREAIVALVLGAIGLLLGGLVVATADGGVGTGNGLGGGVIAMVVGLIGIALGGFALAGSRRAG